VRSTSEAVVVATTRVPRPAPPVVVIDGSTVTVSAPLTPAVPIVVAVPLQSGSPASNPGAVLLPNSQTLFPGQITTISGTVIEVPTIIGTPRPVPPVVVIDGSTVTVPASSTPAAPFIVAPVPLQSGTSALIPGAVLLQNSQTLFPGQITTISGTVISVPTPQAVTPKGPVVVIDGSTVTVLAPLTPAVPIVVAVPSQSGASAAIPGAVLLPNSQTLYPGQVTTLDGTVISVPTPQATTSGGATGAVTPVVVIDGTTITVSSAPISSQSLAGSTSDASTYAPAEATGAAVKMTSGLGDAFVAFLMGLAPLVVA
jgi:hypothetical protein